MTDIDLTIKARPGPDATDWERAMALAEDLARSKHIGERQAKVYAALEVGVDRNTVCDRLEMSQSNSYQTKYDADENVAHAEHLASMLDDHPALSPPKQVTDASMDEFDPKRDGFEGDVRHDTADELTGRQFVDDQDHLVTVRQPLGRETGAGVAGYLVNRIDVDTGGVERRAVSAARLDELRDEGRLTPATATISTDA